MLSKADLLKKTRQYFWQNNFTEVEVPYLNPSLPLEPNIYSFNTIWTHTGDNFYLPTSPELALKRHLAANQNNCFAIGHCFRDLEAAGPHHTPEFLMLEWYEVGKNYRSLMSSVEDYLNQFFHFPTPFKIITLPATLPDNEPDFNQYFLNNIENNLPLEPVFVTGYPAFLAPLAAIHETTNTDHKLTSQRFELYINGIEIANGCTENRNSGSIIASFKNETTYRRTHHLPSHPYSNEFTEISAKLPPSAGVGLGLDRLELLLASYK